MRLGNKNTINKKVRTIQQIYVLNPVKQDRIKHVYDILDVNHKDKQRKSVKLKSSKVLQKKCGKNDMTPPRGLCRTLLIIHDEAI